MPVKSEYPSARKKWSTTLPLPPPKKKKKQNQILSFLFIMIEKSGHPSSLSVNMRYMCTFISVSLRNIIYYDVYVIDVLF